MSLGPGRLHPTHRNLIKRHSGAIKKYVAGDLEWNSDDFTSLKKALRLSLRAQQQGRCIYCRRKVTVERRNAAEDIEHYLDKSKKKYRKWAFSPVNLAISCHPCNMQKSTKDMGDASIATATGLTDASGEYRWLHPYFDDYFENIEIVDAWLYIIKPNAPKANRARNMIRDCLLDQIQTIEAGKLALLSRIEKTNELALRCWDTNPIRAKKLVAHSKMLAVNGWKYI